MALISDEKSDYDIRLQLRGEQIQNPNIVIINITKSDANVFFRKDQFNHRLTTKELYDNSDIFYWNYTTWKILLEKLINQNPAAIGITFFFGDNLVKYWPSVNDNSIFQDPRIVWMSSVYQGDYPLLPFFALSERQNYGNGDLIKDEDGKVRAFHPSNTPLFPHMAIQLSQKTHFAHSNLDYSDLDSKKIINYRGSENVFVHYRLAEILTDQVEPKELEGKIIIIGAENTENTAITTPVGPMSRPGVIAQITDNVLHKRWIHRLPYTFYALELLFIMILSVFIISQYPQTIALVFILIFSGIEITFSLWLFDSFNFWTPIFSPLIQLSTTWILFVGYLVTQIERKNWKLEQKSKSLSQLEQLKNNFISLISHDLKTPIAKIQAIVDRLLMSEIPPSLSDDLKALRGSSHELHKYIQSILRVVRVESKDFKIQKDVVDINELIVAAIMQLKPIALDKKIEIKTTLEPLFSIEVDKTLIQEVFLNLIENAIKYTPANGYIEIISQETDDNIIIKIKDTGEGINPDEINEIFGKFVRGRNQDLKTKGSGLGLYLVKYFIELHGGKINLDSILNKGTEVSIYLPTQQTKEEQV